MAALPKLHNSPLNPAYPGYVQLMDHHGQAPKLLISQIIGNSRSLHFGDHLVELTLSRDLRHGTRELQIDHVSIREDTKGGIGGGSTGMVNPVNIAYMKGKATVEELSRSRERRLAVEHIHDAVKSESFQTLIERVEQALSPLPARRKRTWLRRSA